MLLRDGAAFFIPDPRTALSRDSFRMARDWAHFHEAPVKPLRRGHFNVSPTYQPSGLLPYRSDMITQCQASDRRVWQIQIPASRGKFNRTFQAAFARSRPYSAFTRRSIGTSASAWPQSDRNC